MKTLKEAIPDYCPEEFSDCEVIYENDWNDYEESGWIIVFKFFDELFAWEYNYCVMAENNDVIFNPETINEAQFELIKKHWGTWAKEEL